MTSCRTCRRCMAIKETSVLCLVHGESDEPETCPDYIQSTGTKCERCGVAPAPYFAEDHDPLTQETRVIYLCADCMFRLVRIHDLFLKGADE